MAITSEMIRMAADAGACPEAIEWLRFCPRTFDELREVRPGWLRWAAMRIPGLPLEIVAQMAEDTDCHIRETIAFRPDLTRDLIGRLAADPSYRVRQAIAVRRGLQRELLDRLDADPNVYVRRAVARNPDLPIALIERLAGDDDYQVRASVAGRHPMTHEGPCHQGPYEPRLPCLGFVEAGPT